MKRLYSTLLGRVGLSAALTVVVMACAFLYLRWHVDQGNDLSEDMLLRYLVLGPLCLGLMGFSGLSLLARHPGTMVAESRVCAAAPEASDPQPQLRRPAALQVLGIQWLSPIQRSDYPTQWHLLWAQGLAQPNPDDPRLAEDAKAFDKVDVFQPLIGAQSQPLDAFGSYLDKLLDQLRDGYHSDPAALYTVCAPKPDQRRSLEGIFISCAVPETIDAGAARELVSERVTHAFGLGKAQPVVHVHAGGAEAGVAALKLAQAYLHRFPSHSAWLLSWDAPDLPTPTTSENLVLAILAGPEFDGGRHPLAWLGEPATAKPAAETPDGEQPDAVKLWSTAMHAAVASVDHDGVGHVVHDTTNSAEGIGGLVQALMDAVPDFAIHRGCFDAPKTFGDMGACTVPLSIALAVGRVAHFGGCAAVTVALPGEHGMAAVAVKAPSGDTLPLKGTWFRAATEDFAHLPWWGRRRADSSRPSVLALPT